MERTGNHWLVRTTRGTFSASHLVNTAGAWAGEFAAQVGEPVPVQASGLMLMITYRVAPFVKPVLGATGRALSFKQFANGTVLIGGGLRCEADAKARHGEVDMLKLATSAQTVTALCTHLGPRPNWGTISSQGVQCGKWRPFGKIKYVPPATALGTFMQKAPASAGRPKKVQCAV
ncbi:hypothetical protein A9975_09580 [Cupriavidus sp. UME77]|nr:hypothetical protein [Cupriavidus sp. UME77]